MNKDVFIALLKQFTQFVDCLTENDAIGLASGEKYLSIELVDVKQPSNPKSLSIELVDAKQPSNPKSPSIDLKKIENTLTKTYSREEAEELLKDFKKANLKALAKKLDIPVQSNDNISRLKEKIIESTVGFKLRSQAIQSGDR